MNLRLAAAAAIAAAAGMLVMSGVATVFAVEPGTDDPVCTGQAPFREVAQDEVYTFDERCSIREDASRAERGHGGAVGWAKVR